MAWGLGRVCPFMTQATLRCVQSSLYPTGLPLKQRRNSSLSEPRLVTSSTAIGKMFSCEAPNTANARDGSLESRNSAKEKRSLVTLFTEIN